MSKQTETFRALAGLRPYAVWKGVTARVVNGERMTFAVVDLEPDATVSEHRHENEQIGLVLQGSMTFTIGGEKRQIGPGDTYEIPSNTLHDAIAGPDGCTVVDVFAPVRADWERLERPEPFPPEWPR